jgi:four helix bundle protein
VRKQEKEKRRKGEKEKRRKGEAMKITSHRELEVYQKSFSTAMSLFDFSKQFPKEEMYSLTDQIRRSSRSICGNLAEAWRKRRYEAAFVSKLNECEGEAAETQVWVEFAVNCGYLRRDNGRDIYKTYTEVLSMLVAMIRNPEKWLLPRK